MERSPLTIRVEAHPGHVWLEAWGELDGGTARRLKATMAGLGDAWPALVLDLRATFFMDLAGARAVTDVLARAATAGRLVQVLPSEPVRRLMGILGLPLCSRDLLPRARAHVPAGGLGPAGLIDECDRYRSAARVLEQAGSPPADVMRALAGTVDGRLAPGERDALCRCLADALGVEPDGAGRSAEARRFLTLRDRMQAALAGSEAVCARSATLRREARALRVRPA